MQPETCLIINGHLASSFENVFSLFHCKQLQCWFCYSELNKHCLCYATLQDLYQPHRNFSKSLTLKCWYLAVVSLQLLLCVFMAVSEEISYRSLTSQPEVQILQTWHLAHLLKIVTKCDALLQTFSKALVKHDVKVTCQEIEFKTKLMLLGYDIVYLIARQACCHDKNVHVSLQTSHSLSFLCPFTIWVGLCGLRGASNLPNVAGCNLH